MAATTKRSIASGYYPLLAQSGNPTRPRDVAARGGQGAYFGATSEGR